MLMYRMGFLYMSGQGRTSIINTNNIDQNRSRVSLIAIDDEVALAIECKSSQTHNKATDFTTDLAKYRTTRDDFNKAIKDHFNNPRRAISLIIFMNQVVLTENDRAQADDAGFRF